MLRLISVVVCGLLFACGQPNTTCTKGDRCVHYLSGLPGSPNGTGGNAGPDMAKAPAPADMAKTPAVDMASAPDPDMATGPDMASSCVATGGDCTFHNDALCCSGYCIYSSNTCR